MDASSSISASSPAVQPPAAEKRARFPWALAGFLVLLALTEVWAWTLPAARPGDFLNGMIAAKKELIPSLAPQDVLVFGDSSCAFAVDPQILSEETGLSAFSLATIGDAAMPMNYFLLKDFLKTHEAPRAVILMNTFDGWQRGAHWEGVVGVTAMHYPEKAHELWASPEKPPYLKRSISNFVKFALPSQARRFILRRYLQDARSYLTTGRPAAKPGEVDLKEALLRAKGSYRWALDEVRRRRSSRVRYKPGRQWTRKAGQILPPRLMASEIKTPYFVSQINRRYLRLFLNEAESRGIRVYFCHPPMMRSYYLNPENNENISSYLLFLASAAASSSAGRLLTDDLYAVPANRLYDSNDHLEPKASAEYTREIARRLKAAENL